MEEKEHFCYSVLGRELRQMSLTNLLKFALASNTFQ